MHESMQTSQIFLTIEVRLHSPTPPSETTLEKMTEVFGTTINPCPVCFLPCPALGPQATFIAEEHDAGASPETRSGIPGHQDWDRRGVVLWACLLDQNQIHDQHGRTSPDGVYT